MEIGCAEERSASSEIEAVILVSSSYVSNIKLKVDNKFTWLWTNYRLICYSINSSVYFIDGDLKPSTDGEGGVRRNYIIFLLING